MNVRLQLQGSAVLLPIRAQPGARRNAIVGVHDGMLKVAVTQVAEKGKANDALVDVLAKRLDLRRSQFELIAGATSHEKKFLVQRIALDDLARRIDQALGRDDPEGLCAAETT